MRTFDELEALWHAAPRPPRDRGTVRLLCVREAEGLHRTPEEVEISVEQGVVGDRWFLKPSRHLHSQVTLMNATVAGLVAAGGRDSHWAGDNIHVDFDISAESLPPGSRIRIGEAVLQLSEEPHTGCTTFAGRFGQDALRWVNWRHWRERRLRGVNCRVLEGGTVRLGDAVVRELAVEASA